jgi:hypothetical protein
MAPGLLQALDLRASPAFGAKAQSPYHHHRSVGAGRAERVQEMQ